MNVPSLQNLAFKALANSVSLSTDEQEALTSILESKGHAPLSSLTVLKRKYPERFSDITDALLSDPLYIVSCVQLENISSNIDLMAMSFEGGHPFCYLARSTLQTRFEHGSLNISNDVYEKISNSEYSDGNLTKFALNPQHSLHDIAIQVIAAKLEEGSFSASIYDAEALIPILPAPTTAWAANHVSFFSEYFLKAFAEDDQHPWNVIAKQELATRQTNTPADEAIVVRPDPYPEH